MSNTIIYPKSVNACIIFLKIQNKIYKLVMTSLKHIYYYVTRAPHVGAL